KIDSDHRHDDNDDLRRGITVVKAANTLIESLSDTTGPDDTERCRGSYVGFKTIERKGAPQRHDLRYHAKNYFLHAYCARDANALDGARINRLDRFRKKFREDAEVMNEQGHHACKGTKANRHHKKQREHDFVDGTARIHQSPHRLYDPLGRNVGRA